MVELSCSDIVDFFVVVWYIITIVVSVLIVAYLPEEISPCMKAILCVMSSIIAAVLSYVLYKMAERSVY